MSNISRFWGNFAFFPVFPVDDAGTGGKNRGAGQIP
jgi:hypothetical protein